MNRYECPTCGSNDPMKYARCNHPGCPDGRDRGYRVSPRAFVEVEAQRRVGIRWLFVCWLVILAVFSGLVGYWLGSR